MGQPSNTRDVDELRQPGVALNQEGAGTSDKCPSFFASWGGILRSVTHASQIIPSRAETWLPTATPINYLSPMTLLPSLSPIPSLSLTVLSGVTTQNIACTEILLSRISQKQPKCSSLSRRHPLVPDSTPISEISRSEKPHNPHVSLSNFSVEKHLAGRPQPSQADRTDAESGPTNCICPPSQRLSKTLKDSTSWG